MASFERIVDRSVLNVEPLAANAVYQENSSSNTCSIESFEEHLIQLVKSCPFLWDQSLPDFKHKEKREATWANIAIQVHHPVEECRTKWRLLRDSYSRELRKQKQLRGSESLTKPPWKWFHALHFLQHFIKARTLKGRSPMDCNPSSPNDLDSHLGIPVLDIAASGHVMSSPGASYSCASDAGNGQNEAPGQSRSRRRKRVNKDSTTLALAKVMRRTEIKYDELMNAIASCKAALPTPHRRVEMLCNMMEPSYLSLTPELQSEFEFEVMHLLQCYRKRCTTYVMKHG